jgi:hypothetical protein
MMLRYYMEYWKQSFFCNDVPKPEFGNEGRKPEFGNEGTSIENCKYGRLDNATNGFLFQTSSLPTSQFFKKVKI